MTESVTLLLSQYSKLHLLPTVDGENKNTNSVAEESISFMKVAGMDMSSTIAVDHWTTPTPENFFGIVPLSTTVSLRPNVHVTRNGVD
jgi:hypothetical protein